MQTRKIALSVMTCLIVAGAHAETVLLDGANLTVEDAWKVAQRQAEVAIAPEAMQRLQTSYDLVFDAAKKGVAIYGLTVGVGLNKDTPIFDKNGELSKELLEESRRFNYNLLRSHSGGLGASLPEEVVRLSMVIRLNTLLTGQGGVQPQVAKLYRDMLNKNIVPEVPSQGSIGQADILLGSHVGDVMLGEWEARVDGKLMNGADALKSKGLKPLDPIGKDGLAICSNNSVSIAAAIYAAKGAEHLLRLSPSLYGLSLEGLNGVVAPFSPQVVKVRGTSGLESVAFEIRNALKGSYLWQTSKTRALQDPLSYRTTVHGLNEANRALRDLKTIITEQINSSDDNPSVIANADKSLVNESTQMKSYFIETEKGTGAIIPSGNFESLPVALAVQRLSTALAHVSHNAFQRIMHLSDDHFTGLSRYLSAPGNKGSAFAAISIPVLDRHINTMSMAQPISYYGMPLTGDIEETQANTLQCAQRLGTIVENLTAVYGIELLHSTQAVDLRKLKDKSVKLGEGTQKLYAAYRKVVPFVTKDRIFTRDFRESVKFVHQFAVK